MTKAKYIIMVLIAFLLLLIPSISNADVEVTRYPYSNNGSNKYEFTGLQIDFAKDYEFGLTRTQNEAVKNWHFISERTDTTATVNLTGGTTEFINVIGAYDPNTGKSIPKPKRVCTEYDVNLIKKNGDIINYKAQDYRFTKEAVYITTI